MSRKHLIMALMLGIGVLIGYVIQSGRNQEQRYLRSEGDLAAPLVGGAPTLAVDAESLAALHDQLRQEAQARDKLQARLEALQTRVEELEQARDSDASITTAAASRNPQTSAPKIRTSVQTLIEAGIDEAQAAWIQERLDEIDLQQLQLRDRATREGWLNQPRYHRERREYLNAVPALRDAVGDDTYDRLLYALGRANRVVIRDVMQNSAAAQYGLQAGDQVIEYDGQRVFSSNELSSLATEGSAGAMTLVRVTREGEIQDIYLPRGPIGIRMTATRVAP